MAALALAVLLAAPRDLDAMLAAACRGGADGSVVYRPPGAVRGAIEEGFFRLLFAAARADRPRLVGLLDLPARLLGFRVRVEEEDGVRYAVVTERRRRGAGAYLVRLGPAAEAMVQAPHTFSDKKTLGLARRLARALGARALAVSTIHRRGRRGLGQGTGTSDVAHDATSTFQRVTLAFLAGGRGRLLVQLHGYADGTVAADAVVSAGGEGASPDWLQAVATGLGAGAPAARIAVYPDDVSALGGRSNVQGMAAHAAGARFVHLELAMSLRAALDEAGDDRPLAPLAAALAEAACAP